MAAIRPLAPPPEEVAAEGVEEYSPEEAEQHGLEIPKRSDGEDDCDQGQPGEKKPKVR